MPDYTSLELGSPLGAAVDVRPLKMTIQTPGKDATAIQFPIRLEPGAIAFLDWGRKRTGWLSLRGQGRVSYAMATDMRIFDLFDSPLGQKEGFLGDHFPSFVKGHARSVFELRAEGGKLFEAMTPIRFMKLANTGDAPIDVMDVALKPSEFPALPVGSFSCSDPLVTEGWRMGIDTMHLCTQPSMESQIPIYVPFGNGYVQWDGCRRDREVWSGDLRTSALAWYYTFEDASPITNSLYALLSAQHIACSEHGLFPGSASSHQIYYDGAMSAVVALWEYYLHTGDTRLLDYAVKTPVLTFFLEWCERKLDERGDGWLHVNNSWMYTLPVHDEALPSLQITTAFAMDNMARLFRTAGMEAEALRALAIREKIASRLRAAFWDEGLQSFRFVAHREGIEARSDLCANAWAVLGGLVDKKTQDAIFATLKRLHWREPGSLNVAPPYEFEAPHNNTIWIYGNAHEVAARLYAGDTDNALELFRRYTRATRAMDHRTYLEMFHLDGGLPIKKDGTGETLSFCHAWAALGSWALQRYLLGLHPQEPGWKTVALEPVPSGLEWLESAIHTPYGLIEAKLETKQGRLHGVVTLPHGATLGQRSPAAAQIEVVRK